MRLSLAVIGIAAMIFTPLVRKVEAASELAQALDVVTCLDHENHEAPDNDLDDEDDHGGVTSRTRGRRDGSEARSFVDPRSVTDGLRSLVPGPARLSRSGHGDGPGHAPVWLTAAGCRRQAWLRRFDV